MSGGKREGYNHSNEAPICWSLCCFKQKYTHGDRVQAERQDADNYLKELKDKGVLSEKKIAKDGREYFKFQKKCEYNGISLIHDPSQR